MVLLETRVVEDGESNDCWITEKWHLVSDGGEEYVLGHRTVNGSWFEPTDVWFVVDKSRWEAV